ncbi:hypothetical protein AAFF_G00108870 [Aldrovandia affinis]|uniref:Uncharacterized protein n=1 Tax=Aldrovandia affinis TaxID=143900 RepID=A0AAD7RUC7_9TELE|nr:hypothetical protein AAFF_G00108870 [Aldrovandia affinis]
MSRERALSHGALAGRYPVCVVTLSRGSGAALQLGCTLGGEALVNAEVECGLTVGWATPCGVHSPKDSPSLSVRNSPIGIHFNCGLQSDQDC